MQTTNFLVNGVSNTGLTLVLAHGAGSAMDSPFMDRVADGIAVHGFRVLRFEFPYMRERRLTGKRVRPDCLDLLINDWKKVLSELGDPKKLVIGGKSVGGHFAAKVADEMGVRGVVCLGYPFLLPHNQEPFDISHLFKMKSPTIIIQGSHDPYGQQGTINEDAISSTATLHWLPKANHDLHPVAGCNKTYDENILEAMEKVAEFIDFLQN